MKPYNGIWPVAPTAFNPDGTLDDDGNRRIMDCMIDQGSDRVCILANYSEQFLLSDAEREALTRLSLEHVAGRVPVIVTISHFATDIAVARAHQAKDMGADVVMMMAPYHGALMKGTPAQTFEQFQRVRDGDYDAVVTMYHDQGQIAIKLLGFDKGVSVLAGLPLPLTTPAHGTAFDIAGQNKANLVPTKNSFKMCLNMASNRHASEGVETADT